jgi:hypothetical protein
MLYMTKRSKGALYSGLSLTVSPSLKIARALNKLNTVNDPINALGIY